MNSAANTATETTTIHPFEKAGLGKAPFRFVGMGQQDRCYGQVILNRAEYERTGIALTTKPGGTCAFCGEAILNLYEIKSADGKRFHVGCECVKKTGDAALVKVVAKAKLALDRAKRAAKATAQATELAALLADEATRARLAALPHPNGHMTAKSETLLGWAEWMAKRAGATGRARVLKTLKA